VECASSAEASELADSAQACNGEFAHLMRVRRFDRRIHGEMANSRMVGWLAG
jgi:hypothetical protein